MRYFVAITALLASLAQAGPKHQDRNNYNLNTLAQARGKQWFGTAADIPGTDETTDAAYLKILKSQFGEITPANALKFMYTEQEQNKFNFTDGDYFMDLAERFDSKVRCHNLVWMSQVSDFVTSKTWTAKELIAVMKNHIFKMVQHYGKRCASWDVVNEAAINDDGTFSSSVWYNTIGEEYFYLAFQYAQQVLSQIGANDNSGTKADAVLRLVKNLRKRGIRIDGIGLESHFIVGQTPSLADQLATKKAYIKADLDVIVTELDIRFAEEPYYTADVQKQQAADYYLTVQSCLQAGSRCLGVVVWDFYDKYSWVPETFAGQGGATLFNDTLEAKPAYYAVVEALHGKKCTVC
ncbi:Glycoside hydrolase superfamily [Penicillium cf. viridicatum]|uniref:Beta-xylanase n=1 Tax=Penicillium cf. viridicatum TaxID=2972119 RepID=A0A9W9T898_9EURO|nr:Glycoside hydrolase superfamily [Penicillium cf. viridicatum]